MAKPFIMLRIISVLVWGTGGFAAPSLAQGENFSQREHEIMAAWSEFVAEQDGTLAEVPAFSGRIPQEAIARKARSEAVLNRRGVPVLDSLPVIETAAQSRRLSSRAVAERALALMVVTIKADTRDNALALEVMAAYGAEAYLTAQEREYVFSTATTEDDHVQNVWRYEALNTLLWALGYTDNFGHPDKISDIDWIAEELLELGPEGVFTQARLRSQSELLDQADLIYRYHWAALEAHEDGRTMPASVNPNIILERHYTLNWLIGYFDQAWDDITTDT